MQVTIDRFGRMVLPKGLRDDLGLRPGDKLDAREEGNAIVLRPACRDDVVRVREGVLIVAASADGDMSHAVDGHRRDRLNDAAGWEARA